MHGRCWLGGRKGIWPVKNWVVGAGVVVCLEWGADLHMAQLMPLPLTVSCSIGFTFLVPAHLGSPGKRAVKWVCVCVCLAFLSCRWSVLHNRPLCTKLNACFLAGIYVLISGFTDFSGNNCRCCRALLLVVWYTSPVLLRVEGWVSPSAWLHGKVICQSPVPVLTRSDVK